MLPQCQKSVSPRRQLPPCPSCGGETFVDSFEWPRKPRVWYVRCTQCWAMSQEDVPTEEEAYELTINFKE